MGALIVESTAQSRTRVMAMELSVDADNNLPRLGNISVLTVEVWCRRDPSSWFLLDVAGKSGLAECVSGEEEAASW